MKRFCATFLIFGLAVISTCLADEDDGGKESMEDVRDKFGDAIGDSMKGLGDWFRSTAEEVKERAESGVETMKEFSDQAKDKSESGLDAAKGFAGGIGDRLSKVKESIESSGEKMKDALSGAAQKSKGEFETAASTISKHAKEASDTMFGLFKFK